MGVSRDLGKEFPSVLDSAYKEYMRHLEINEVMSRGVVTTTPETSMYDAAKIMGVKHIGSLIVVKYETPVAIVTERDLLTKVLAKGLNPKEVMIDGVMSYPLIKICPTAKIRDAAQMMIKKKGRIAVFECGNIVGIITASDLIRSLPEAPETMTKVDGFITKEVVTSDEKATVASIVKIMGEKRIGSVIVTRGGNPMGIFTERDLLTEIMAKDVPLDIEVGKASSSPLITASLGISVHEAARTMAVKHVRRLPIVKEGKLAGIITARDLVEAYAR